MDGNLYAQALRIFGKHFGGAPEAVAYAPGRVEVLGNHTDYNEGYVLSAAIDRGTAFLARLAPDAACRVIAGDIEQSAQFPVSGTPAAPIPQWARYVRGVFEKLRAHGRITRGFHAVFLGNIPLGAGLSSSAALEIASGLALERLYGLSLPPLDLARIGQAAEHEYVGVKCGLLDQISSLFGKENELVMTDFRMLTVETIPLAPDVCFLVCNTRVKHNLVESEYNERRARCEAAAAFFRNVLPHPVSHLRDVSQAEWDRYHDQMEPVAAKRAAHVVGEDERVLQGRDLLRQHKLREFGELMFESHHSSRVYFENSCAELDAIVQAARGQAGVYGARLSGGGFGGSAIVLVGERSAQAVGESIAAAYNREFGHPCEFMTVKPSTGARVAEPAG